MHEESVGLTLIVPIELSDPTSLLSALAWLPLPVQSILVSFQLTDNTAVVGLRTVTGGLVAIGTVALRFVSVGTIAFRLVSIGAIAIAVVGCLGLVATTIFAPESV